MTIDAARAEIVVTGTGAVTDACDPAPFVRLRKLRKFMGRQDDLAVTAAGVALQAASITGSLGERCGLYLAVGYIPFEAADIDQLLGASLDGDRFSMACFASRGFGAINPLLTFRVLPNMPAFHVSLNFDVQGPYLVTYPGIGQFYGALEEAICALNDRLVDIALVGGVADQTNALVEHHFSRITPPVDPSRLSDAAAFLVLERAADAQARGVAPRARLLDYRLDYRPVDPFGDSPPSECIARDGVCVNGGRHFGPASLGVALSAPGPARLTHRACTRDGFTAASTWETA